MTTISKSSFSSWACDMSQKGECASISWEMTSGDTRKRRSSPVSKPTLMSVWSSGINSPEDDSKWVSEKQSISSLWYHKILLQEPTTRLRKNQVQNKCLINPLSTIQRSFQLSLFTPEIVFWVSFVWQDKVTCSTIRAFLTNKSKQKCPKLFVKSNQRQV